MKKLSSVPESSPSRSPIEKRGTRFSDFSDCILSTIHLIENDDKCNRAKKHKSNKNHSPLSIVLPSILCNVQWVQKSTNTVFFSFTHFVTFPEKRLYRVRAVIPLKHNKCHETRSAWLIDPTLTAKWLNNRKKHKDRVIFEWHQQKIQQSTEKKEGLQNKQ